MPHTGSHVERLGVRCQLDEALVAIDGLLTWQEFQATIAAIVGGPVALAEQKVTTECDGGRGTVVTYGRLTEESARRLRRALASPPDPH